MNMTNATTRLIAATIFTLMASSLSAVASAADPAFETTVKYADLEISSTQGAAVLYQRIQSAAVKVCARLDHGDLISKRNATMCKATSIADAVSRVNQPVLNALHNQKTGQSSPLLVAAK